MRRIAMTCLALVALLVVTGAVASTAVAQRLTLSEAGTALQPGSTFELVGQDLLVTTSRGALECETFFQPPRLAVSLLTNSQGRDELQIKRLENAFRQPCRSYTGNAAFFLESLGEVLTLRATGIATAGPVALLIRYEHVEFQEDVECFFTGNRVTGSNSATATVQPLEVELGGTLKLDPSRSSVNAKNVCPAEAGIDFSLPSTESELGEVIDEQVTA